MNIFIRILFLAALATTAALHGQGFDAAKVKVALHGQARANEGGGGEETFDASYSIYVPDLLAEGGSTSGSTQSPGATFDASTSFMWMEPGRSYIITTSASNCAETNVAIDPPMGYAIEFNGVEQATYGDPSTIRLVPKRETFTGRAGTASSLASDKVYWQVALGYLSNGDPARSLAILDAGRGTDWNDVFTPTGINVQSSSDEVRRILTPAGTAAPFQVGELRQVVTNEAYVDIVPASGRQSYQLKFYSRDTGGATAGSTSIDPYTFTGYPFVVYTVEKVAATHLKITREDKNATGTTIRTLTTRVERTGTSASNFIWTVDDWHQGTTSLVTEVNTWSERVVGTVTRRVETLVKKNNLNVVAMQSVQEFEPQAWGEELVYTERGDSNPIKETLTYHKWWGTGDMGPLNLRVKKSASGAWEAYDALNGNRPRRTYRPVNGLPADPQTAANPDTWNTSLGEVTYRTFAPGSFDRIGSITTTVAGVQTAKSTTGYTEAGGIVTATRSDWVSNVAGDAKLVTVTKYFREDAASELLRHQLHSVQTPNGVKQAFAYQRGDFDVGTRVFTKNATGASVRVAVIQGTSDNTGSTPLSTYDTYNLDPLRVVAGKSTLQITIRDGSARMARRETHVYNGTDWTLLTAEDTYFDYANRIVQRTTTSAGSAAITLYSATYKTTAAGAGNTPGLLEAEEDGEGVRTEYTYDNGGRVLTAVKVGTGSFSNLVTTFTYNANNQILSEVVSKVGVSETITTARSYDRAGRISTETPAGLGATSYSYDPAVGTQTVTQASGGYRTETYGIDGRLQSITGTGQTAEHYTYSFPSGQTYVKVNFHTSNNARKAEMWKDQLGRKIKLSKPGFGGTTALEQAFFYDDTPATPPTKPKGSTGLLWKSTRTGYAPTLYEYDQFGQLTRRGLDITITGASAGVLTTDSEDRITDCDQWYELYDDKWWLSSIVKTYFTKDSGTSHVISRTRDRITGLSGNLRGETRYRDSDLEQENKDLVRTLSIDRGTKTSTLVMQRPGHSVNAEVVKINGLASTRKGHDGVTLTFGYDGLQRLQTQQHPRIGTTTSYYHPGTRLVSVLEDATKATGVDGNKVQFFYDTSGRPNVTIDPAGAYTRVEYTASGAVRHQWGSGATPVEYGYDDFGMQTSVTTYRAGSSWNGTSWPSTAGALAGSTDWVFDPDSGLLSAKVIGGNQTDFLYNNSGQLEQRKSPRPWGSGRITTTYSYDPKTAEMTSVAYNDSTPSHRYEYTRTGQLLSAERLTGEALTVDLTYDPTSPWRLTTEDWGDYFGGRLLTHTYEGGSAVGAANSFHTHTAATQAGRSSGFKLGTAAALGQDRHDTFVYSEHGRPVGVKSGVAGTAQRDFVYSYQAQDSLVTGYTSGSFARSVAYHPKRDLVSQITTTWSGLGTIADHEYRYDGRGLRATVKQAAVGAYSDYGGSTYDRYAYTPRGEIESSATYLGDNPDADWTPQLSGRNFHYTYDQAGNRMTGSRTGKEGIVEDYSPNDQNQYENKESHAVTVGGTANDQATISVSGGTVAAVAGRQGRFWGAQVMLPNGGGPASASLTINAAVGGTATSLSRLSFIGPANTSFDYDEEGNLVRDGVWEYRWDAENRLVEMQPVAPAVEAGLPDRTIRFQYDFRGRRIQKQILGAQNETRRYVYHGWNVAAELEPVGATWNLRRGFSWGLDVAGSFTASGGVGALLQIVHPTGTLAGTYLATSDANGNVLALIRDNGASGTIAASYEYSPFGELLRAEGAYAQENPFRFSSKWTDAEAGLVYYGHRFFSPALGRFINRDPLGESGGLNLYGMCGNNSVNRWDILGLAEPTTVGMPEGGSSGTWDNIIKLGGFEWWGGGIVASQPLADGAVAGSHNGSPMEAKTLTPFVVQQGGKISVTIPPLIAEKLQPPARTYADWGGQGPDAAMIAGAVLVTTEVGTELVTAAEIEAAMRELRTLNGRGLSGRVLGIRSLIVWLALLSLSGEDPINYNARRAHMAHVDTKIWNDDAKELLKNYYIPADADDALVKEFFENLHSDPRYARYLLDLMQRYDRKFQVHHFLSNINKVYTPLFQAIVAKYGLDLDGNWNKAILPQSGKHPILYHRFVLDELEKIDAIANGDRVKFLQLFEERIATPIRQSPDLLYKSGWK